MYVNTWSLFEMDRILWIPAGISGGVKSTDPGSNFIVLEIFLSYFFSTQVSISYLRGDIFCI